MRLIDRNSCPLCQSEDIKLHKKGTVNPKNISTEDFKITDSHYGSLWNFSMCQNCRFVFFNPYVPEEDILEFYSQLEDTEYSAEADNRAKNFTTVLQRIGKLRNEIPPQNDKLLDVGAASGIFLNLAQQDGYETEGIEPSDFLVKEAKNRYGLELFKGTVEEFETENKYAVITLLDIIEHLVNPDAFMSHVDRLIADNGILVLVTPDVNSLTARLMGKRWWHYRIAHINFFNLPSIRFLLEKHGYEIVLKKKYVWNFSVYYLATRLLPFLKNKKTLQKTLKRLHLKLPLMDSWEIYACKRN